MKQFLDKIPRPPGALPARAQSWVLMGLTAVLVLALLLFPGEPEAPPAQGGAEAALEAQARAPQPVGVKSAQTAAQRLREEAAREAEQRLRRELGVPAERADGLPHAPTPLLRAAPGYSAGYASAGAVTPQQQIRQQEVLRRHRSLSAPPLVHSRRESGPSAAAAVPEAAAAGPAAAADLAETPEPAAPAEEPDPAHILREGEFFEAVLTNRLSGDFSGPVNAMVSADVYDRAGQLLLIPRGARALGEAMQVDNWGQSRLAVVFHRLILPNGAALSLDHSAALNQIGETGLKDIVDRRYPSAFLAAGAIGTLAGLAGATSPAQAFDSRVGAARQSAGLGLSQVAERMLDRYLNRLPKITIREGHRMRVYLMADLALQPYPAPHQGETTQ